MTNNISLAGSYISPSNKEFYSLHAPILVVDKINKVTGSITVALRGDFRTNMQTFDLSGSYIPGKSLEVSFDSFDLTLPFVVYSSVSLDSVIGSYIANKNEQVSHMVLAVVNEKI